MASEPAAERRAPRVAILAREYGRARGPAPAVSARYNRFVGWMKFVLPGVAALLIAVVAIWPLVSPRNDRIPIGLSTVSQEEIDQLRMINPRYIGVDGRNQPFSVTASSATQVDPKKDMVELEQPKADITLQNGTWIALTATNGTFSQKEQVIQLSDNVNMFHDAGYEFRTQRAVIDLSAGTAYGQDPVEGQGPYGAISAQGFRVLDKGARIVFAGKAKLFIQPQHTPQARKAGAR
ncbi:MAG: LPS export ABC transporter periplasmic protein LptC [Alphaproteobacteria bacterium]